jgi:hypothetical protein
VVEDRRERRSIMMPLASLRARFQLLLTTASDLNRASACVASGAV